MEELQSCPADKIKANQKHLTVWFSEGVQFSTLLAIIQTRTFSESERGSSRTMTDRNWDCPKQTRMSDQSIGRELSDGKCLCLIAHIIVETGAWILWVRISFIAHIQDEAVPLIFYFHNSLYSLYFPKFATWITGVTWDHFNCYRANIKFFKLACQIYIFGSKILK